MKILGGGGRRLGKRGAAFVVAGALMAFQAIGIIGAQVASASTCTFSGGVLTVASAAAESITVSRNVAGTIAVSTCGSTGGATVANTTAIALSGNADAQQVTIVLTNGGFGTIDWTIDLDGTPAASVQQLTIVGDGTATSNQSVVVGASGVDLNGDGDLDVTSLTGLSTSAGSPFAVTIIGPGGGAPPQGNNFLSAAGDTTTGAAFPMGVFIIGQGNNSDDIAGGAGNDLLVGTLSAFAILDCSAATAAQVHIPTGGSNATFGGAAAVAGDTCGGGSDFWDDFAGVIGSPGTDTLVGSAAGEYFAPNGGANNVVTGGGGNDELDFSFEASGITVDTKAGTGVSEDGTSNTTFTGKFFVDGSDFVDTLDFSGETGPIAANLGDTALVPADTAFCGPDTANDVDGATTVNGSKAFENAIGSAKGDTISGSGANNSLNGGEGDDKLCGLAANDTLLGGPGNNSLDGGTGFDATSYADVPVEPGETGVEADLTVGFGSGPDRNDVVANIENLTGSDGKDDLRGSDGNNTIKGGKSADNIRGGSGDDTLRGGAGKDAVRGGSGDDDLFGGGANDKLFGGGGTDFGDGGKGKDVCQGVEIKKSCGTKTNPKSPQTQVAARRQI
jgi:hypothetical protein